MTVKELLDELKFMDKDAIVVLPGYEDGYNAVRAALPTFMVDYHDPKWYYGAFEEADAGTSAVILR
jgi:hypothetical protein